MPSAQPSLPIPVPRHDKQHAFQVPSRFLRATSPRDSIDAGVHARGRPNWYSSECVATGGQVLELGSEDDERERPAAEPPDTNDKTGDDQAVSGAPLSSARSAQPTRLEGHSDRSEKLMGQEESVTVAADYGSIFEGFAQAEISTWLEGVRQRVEEWERAVVEAGPAERWEDYLDTSLQQLLRKED